MTSTTDPHNGLPAIHPGEHLRDDLDALEMSAAELARQLKVPTNRVTEILNGQRAITADTALRLGQFFGTGPELWLRLQQRYDLKKARAEIGPEVDTIRRYEPINQMGGNQMGGDPAPASH